MKVKSALILCAGYGKRLQPITNDTPKSLLKIKNINLLDNTLNFVKSIGINNIKLKDGRIIDLVYKNGKLKAYEIIDNAYFELFKTLGGVSSHYTGRLSNFINGLFDTSESLIFGTNSKISLGIFLYQFISLINFVLS